MIIRVLVGILMSAMMLVFSVCCVMIYVGGNRCSDLLIIWWVCISCGMFD